MSSLFAESEHIDKERKPNKEKLPQKRKEVKKSENIPVKETTNLCSNVAANDYLFYRSLMDPRGNQRGGKQQLKRL